MSAGAVTVRPMESADLEAVLDQIEAIAAEGRWLALEAPVDRDGMRARLADGIGRADALVLVAEVDGEPAGNLGLRPVRNGVATLGMSVAAQQRGRGVGRALLDEAIRWARAQGLHKLTLDVFPHNDAAIALYRRAGFVEEGLLRRHHLRRDGELWDAVLMALYL